MGGPSHSHGRREKAAAIEYAQGLEVVEFSNEKERHINNNHLTLPEDESPELVVAEGKEAIPTISPSSSSLDSSDKIAISSPSVPSNNNAATAAELQTDNNNHDNNNGGGSEAAGGNDRKRKPILGLPPRTFWIIFGTVTGIIILIVIIATLATLLVTKSSGQDDLPSGASLPSHGVFESSTPPISSATSTSTSTSITNTRSNGGASSPTSTSTTSSISSSSSSSSTKTSTATSSAPTTQTTTGPSGVTVECPWADLTNYTSSSSSGQQKPKTFQKQCGVNYMFFDIRNQTTNSFDECLDLCSREEGCVVANWQYWGPQGTDENYCWLKRGMGEKRVGGGVESGVLVGLLD